MMDFTDPFAGMARPKMTDAQLAQAIRIDMAAELDAINLYQSHMESTDNPVARQMIQHIMEEEKDHLEEFAQLLYILDPRQAEAVEHAKVEMEEHGSAPAEIGEEPEQGGDGMRISVPGMTVGSLRE